jgi:hypothetical protein
MRSRAVLGRLAACVAAVIVLMGAGAVSASASAPGKAHLSSGTNNQANSSGTATKVKRKDGGGALLTSTNYGYGSIAVHIPSPVTMNALTALNTDFEVKKEPAREDLRDSRSSFAHQGPGDRRTIRPCSSISARSPTEDAPHRNHKPQTPRNPTGGRAMAKRRFLRH